MNAVTIGTVPYLNGRPLVRWFWDTEEGRASGVSVVEAVPSELARMLARGEVAAALVSSFAYFHTSGLAYAPGIAVAANGPVRSVRLLSRVPLNKIETVALDTSSLTSVALLKILLRESYGLEPRYLPMPPELNAMLAQADAALLIGDLGYKEYDPSYHVLDLGDAWKTLTGLPFVYALWLGSQEKLTSSLCATLLHAREWGEAHLYDIAQHEFSRLDETFDRAYQYLTDIMVYDLAETEEKALHLFGAKLSTNHLLPAASEEIATR